MPSFESDEMGFFFTLKDRKNNIVVYDIIHTIDIQKAKEIGSKKYPSYFETISVVPV